ncbi:unnamed protein product [Lepeophtheirus salmonis]|uniref:(salmon louse) hypothetical protein n=1 Tax=Lepeophtheirus salmonis TaxID=72036 RepID=A0A7R8CS32_LEPSM|nr:unnamed protein product [Lepeophtheirus salmonis]CAF2910745.1 unnamed protein product [Lepeophtheirus salmonis]
MKFIVSFLMIFLFTYRVNGRQIRHADHETAGRSEDNLTYKSNLSNGQASDVGYGHDVGYGPDVGYGHDVGYGPDVGYGHDVSYGDSHGKGLGKSYGPGKSHN